MIELNILSGLVLDIICLEHRFRENTQQERDINNLKEKDLKEIDSRYLFEKGIHVRWNNI